MINATTEGTYKTKTISVCKAWKGWHTCVNYLMNAKLCYQT